MQRARKYGMIISLFFIGVLSTTVFIQNTTFRKKFSSRSAEYSLIVKSPESSADQKQNPFGSNLVSEEEEETHLKTETVQAPDTQRSFILIPNSFSSPNLFFKEYFLDVTSPPPWA